MDAARGKPIAFSEHGPSRATPEEDNMAQTTYTITTFSDPENAALPDRYLAGLRDPDGKARGLIMPGSGYALSS
jgi:hypothetical protein